MPKWLRDPIDLSAVAPVTARIDDYALVDIDDTIKEVHGYQKQGSGYGYSGVRGLNALLGILSTTAAAPVIIGSRLRKGAAGSPRGAGKFVADILATVRRLRTSTATGLVLLRADSAFYGHAVVAAAHRAGAKVSITARMDPAVRKAIATIGAVGLAACPARVLPTQRAEARATAVGAAEVQRVRARDRRMGRLAPLNEPAYSPAVH